MSIQSLEDLFLHGLQDLYYAQNQIAKYLREIMQKPLEVSLFDNLEHHLEETEEQIGRLQQLFSALGQDAKGVTCQAILGLIEESEELSRDISTDNLRDAALLGAVQTIEGYETARYTTLLAWSDQLPSSSITAKSVLAGLEVADLLQLGLDECKNQESRLTAIAQSRLGRYVSA